MNEGESEVLLSPPHLTGEEEFFLQNALETNWVAPVGPHIDAFEKELAEETGTGHACALNSGTAAIHLGLKLLGVGPGDIVLCSSLTFVASANPIRYLGAEPFFVDSDPESWCMSIPALERALATIEKQGKKAKACIVVSLYGQCADFAGIQEICDLHGVRLMDEAAESLGATMQGKMAGSFGDLGVYSFNGNKIITTSGGGALVSDDEQLIQRAKHLSTQSRDHSKILAYEHSVIGYNYRMSNLLAGVGRAQLKVLSQRVNTRRMIFERYRSELQDLPCLEWMPESPEGRSTRWLTSGLVGDMKIRDQLISELQGNNIDARPVWKPMHLQALYKSCEYATHSPEIDVARDLFERGICLPSGSNLSRESQGRVIKVIRDTLE